MRLFHMMAYDGARDEVVLFGGLGWRGWLTDTWTWDGQKWTEEHPRHRPAQMVNPAMTYDPGREEIVLWATDGPRFNTWTWNGHDWTQHRTAVEPSPRLSPALGYDPVSEQVVLFGGFDWTTERLLNDTWTWDGADWTLQRPAVSPAPREYPLTASDPLNSHLLLFGGCCTEDRSDYLNDTWTWDGGNWTQKDTAMAPPTRSAAMMSNGVPGKVMLYGGLYKSGSGRQEARTDLWTWDGASWTQETPPTLPFGYSYRSGMAANPAGRGVVFFSGDFTSRWDGVAWEDVGITSPVADQLSSAMTYDSHDKALVLFDSRGQSCRYEKCGGTWTWTGDQWTEHEVEVAPTARYHPAMAYDARSRGVVLFGGNTRSVEPPEPVADTWTWSGTGWTQQHPPVSPPARGSHMMAFDAARREVVLFGGAGAGSYLGDTWVWDGVTWTERHPLTSPPARVIGGMSFDRKRQEIVLFGGMGASQEALRDTWTWDGATWVEESPTRTPPHTIGPSMAYDAVSQTTVMFGGIDSISYGATASDETWVWDGTDWTGPPDAYPLANSDEAQPRSRWMGRMAAHPPTGTLLLFGGQIGGQPGTIDNEVWSWGAGRGADVQAPETRIASHPPDPTDERTARFAFGSNEADSSFECRVDPESDKDWADCDSPATYENLTEGAHTFQVRAVDVFEKRDPSPATFGWTIGSGPSPPAPYNLGATASSGTEIALSWSNSSSPDTLELAIERSSSRDEWEEVQRVPNGATSYLDTGLAPGTDYRYRVRSRSTAAYSSYSNVASTTTPGSSGPTPTPSEGSRGAFPLAPNDSYFDQQWAVAKIQAPQAWQEDQATGFGVKVAVIDSGLDLGHPDFACGGKVVPGAALIDGEVLKGDKAQDIDGHGTHVAGIIGACTNNGIGTIGIAPDASVTPYRVFTTEAEGAGELNDIAVAIIQATDDGAHVINMSLGIGIGDVPLVGGAVGYLPDLLPQIDDAIEYAQSKGVVVVIAAGNSAVLPLCEYPAIAEDAICVGATDPNDLKAWYGTFPNKTDADDIVGPSLSAPGGQGTWCEEGILSTFLRSPPNEQYCSPASGYDAIDGTSMAVPHVAGVAALLYDRLGASRSAANRVAITDALLDSSVDLGTPGYDPIYGYGRLDALAAVTAVTAVPHAIQSTSPTETESPTETASPTESANPTETASPTDDPSESPRDDPSQGPGPVAPVGPSNLTAAAASSTRVQLGWSDNSNNETSFAIERAGGGGNWQEIATGATNQTSFVDMGLTPNTTYNYRVRAYNSVGHSDYSNVAGATTPAATSGGTSAQAPAAPGNLTGSASSSSRIELGWTDNSNNEDGFAIERSGNDGVWQEITTTGRNQTSYVDSGLAAETTYRYRVRAYNSVGHSTYSNVAEATTQQAPASGGEPSPEPTESSGPVEPVAVGSATTSIAASRSLTAYNEGFELSGVVSRDADCTGPLEVEVSRRIHGTSAYESVASTTVDGAGQWGLQVVGQRNASYVAHVKETDTCQGDASVPTDVLVRAKIAARIPARCSGNVRGRVLPAYEGSEVTLQRRAKGRWVEVTSDVLDARSRFVLRAVRCGLHRVTWSGEGTANEAAKSRFRL